MSRRRGSGGWSERALPAVSVLIALILIATMLAGVCQPAGPGV